MWKISHCNYVIYSHLFALDLTFKHLLEVFIDVKGYGLYWQQALVTAMRKNLLTARRIKVIIWKVLYKSCNWKQKNRKSDYSLFREAAAFMAKSKTLTSFLRCCRKKWQSFVFAQAKFICHRKKFPKPTSSMTSQGRNNKYGNAA